MSKVPSSVGTISRPGSRWTARRRLHNGDPKAIARHNRQVGEVLHAFNSAQASFFLIFWQLSSREDIELAMDLWEALLSDSAQRRTVDIYVRRSIRRKAIQSAIIWAIDVVDELSKHRNDVVHSNVFADIDRIRPDLGTKRARAARLEKTPTEKIWRDLRGDLSAIANYVSDLHLDLSAGNAWPSTKRPRLKLAQPKSAQRQSQRRRAKHLKKESQRQSSQK